MSYTCSTVQPTATSSIGATWDVDPAFNEDISNWDTSNVKNMTGMFQCNNPSLAPTFFNQNIGSWDVSSVENMSAMFAGATNFDNNGSNDIGELEYN